MYNGVRMSHLLNANQNNNKQRYITLFNLDKTLLCTKM